MQRLQHILQLPPTPTPYPSQSAPPVELPPIDAWDFVGGSIQTWNTMAQLTVFFQAIVILAIIILIYMALSRIARYLGSDRQ